jgi:hypothetical protein
MADVANRLPLRVEDKVSRRPDFGTELNRTDGGGQFTNQRWSAPLWVWDITIPLIRPDGAEYAAVHALLEATGGDARTFDFHDPITCADVEVRLVAGSYVETGAGKLVNIDMSLEMAR